MTKPGYGWAHQQARTLALSTLVPGTRCPLCHLPMYAWQALDLDHAVPIMHGGMHGATRLVHRHCNRSSGASMGNIVRRNGKRKRKGIGNSGANKRNASIANKIKRLPQW